MLLGSGLCGAFVLICWLAACFLVMRCDLRCFGCFDIGVGCCGLRVVPG